MKILRALTSGSRQRDAASLRLAVILIFYLVVLLFTLATAYSQFVASSIQKSSKAIANDDSPSIQHLTAVRAEVRRLEGLARIYPSAKVSSRIRLSKDIEDSLQRVGAELAAYLALPTYPAEAPGARMIRQSMPLLMSKMKVMTTLSNEGDEKKATRVFDEEVEPIIEGLKKTAFDTIEVDASHIHLLADNIESARYRSLLIAIGLNIFIILLTLILATLVLQIIERYARLAVIEMRAKELELFAGAVSHDLKNPIGSVRLALEAAASKLNTQCSLSKTLIGQAVKNLDQMTQLVDGLLEFASAGARPRADERASLPQVIEDVMREAVPRAERKGIELKVAPFEDIQVSCSGVMVGTVLRNLIDNAIKYMGDRPDRRIQIRAWRGKAFLRIEVEDTGPGVPSEVQDKIFETYVRAPGLRQPGLGIGLATVKRIVVAHDGKVGLRSQPGRGSVFWFELPIFRSQVQQLGKNEKAA